MFDGQPLNMAEIMQPGLDVVYIFASPTSPVGLSAARLTRSFFRAQNTELKIKESLNEKLHTQLGMHSHSSRITTSILQREVNSLLQSYIVCLSYDVYKIYGITLPN